MPAACRALAVLALPAILGAGWLHTELKVSDPAEDEVLTESPSEVTLTYTTDVQLTLSTVAVRPSAAGAAAVPASELRYLADDRHDVLVLPLSGPLASDSYTVEWTTAGPDGHKLSGDFEFRLDLSAQLESANPPGAAVAGADPATPPGEGEPPSAGDAPGRDSSRSGARGGAAVFDFGGTALGFLFYTGIVGVLGAVVFRSLVLARLEGDGKSRGVVDYAARRASLIVAMGLGFLLVLAPIRLWNQAAEFFPGDATGNLLTVATGTPWAAGWWLQVASVALVGAGLLIRGKDGVRPFGWQVIALGAVLLPLVPLLSGHGWADSPRVVSAAATYLHVVAAGGWMGGLGCLLFAGLPAVRAHRGGASPKGPGISRMVGAFSRVAQAAVAVLLITGALKVWIHIDAASDLWTTAWGRSLLVKGLVVAGVLGLGLYNWRVVRPRLERASSGDLLKRSATIELALGTAAVVVTSFLVAQPLS